MHALGIDWIALVAALLKLSILAAWLVFAIAYRMLGTGRLAGSLHGAHDEHRDA